MCAVCWLLLIFLLLTSFGTLVIGSESNPQILMPWEFFMHVLNDPGIREYKYGKGLYVPSFLIPFFMV